MKTVEVRILPAITLEDSGGGDSFLMVETTSSPDGERTNIDHVHRDAEDSDTISKDSVVSALPTTHENAIQWAASFAALNNIPVVYERQKT